jgi:hypothetical protein
MKFVQRLAKEAHDLERYEAEMKRYRQLMKAIHNSNALVKDDDVLFELFTNGDFQAPKHKYNGKSPV